MHIKSLTKIIFQMNFDIRLVQHNSKKDKTKRKTCTNYKENGARSYIKHNKHLSHLFIDDINTAKTKCAYKNKCEIAAG